jgi:hypothetical protein
MSRSVMRERFSASIKKPIYTFTFDRFVPLDPAILTKLQKARDSKAVVCATPTSVKAFVIKLIELMHSLDYSQAQGQEQKEESRSNWRMKLLGRRRSGIKSTVEDLQQQVRCHILCGRFFGQTQIQFNSTPLIDFVLCCVFIRCLLCSAGSVRGDIQTNARRCIDY